MFCLSADLNCFSFSHQPTLLNFGVLCSFCQTPQGCSIMLLNVLLSFLCYLLIKRTHAFLMHNKCGLIFSLTLVLLFNSLSQKLRCRDINIFRFMKEKNALTYSRWRLLSYRNQSIDFRSKLMDWFLYDNGLRHERIKQNQLNSTMSWIQLKMNWKCLLTLYLNLYNESKLMSGRMLFFHSSAT